MSDPLQLLAPLPTWCDSAHAGVLRNDDGLREVMVFLRRTQVDTGLPSLASPASLPGGIGLIGVLPFHGSQAWIYPLVPALGLPHLTRPGNRLSPRTAAELIASLAERLMGMRDQLDRIDLASDRVGLDATGQVHLLLGHDTESEAPVLGSRLAVDHWTVQRLGVLWAELLEGPLTRVSSRSGQRTIAERLTRRAVANEALPARYIDWMGGMLTPDENLRPPLSTVASGLRRLAADSSGLGLADWARIEVPRMLVEDQPEAPATLDGEPWLPWSASSVWDSEIPDDEPAPLSNGPTDPGIDLRAILPATPDDDATFIPPGKGCSPDAAPVNEPGVMPVGVGPPVALATMDRPRLPTGFLDPEETTSRLTAPQPRDWRSIPMLRFLFGTVEKTS